MIRKTGFQNQKNVDLVASDWDGIDRRQQERRIIETVESDLQNKVVAETAGASFISRYGSALAGVMSILATLVGFGASLYSRVSSMEVKIETVKADVVDIKNSIKEQEKTKKQLEEHVSSIEETMMQLYRQRK